MRCGPGRWPGEWPRRSAGALCHGLLSGWDLATTKPGDDVAAAADVAVSLP
jgi:hypothetical protein